MSSQNRQTEEKMTVQELKDYFDGLLDTESFSSLDASLNGLQVGLADRKVSKVAFAEDANIHTISRASELGAGLLFVHHGIFWGRASAVTGAQYERIRLLIENGLALYAAHLPLDCHKRLSHNACMANLLGLKDVKSFASVGAGEAGLYGEFEEPVEIRDICRALGREEPQFIMGEERKIKRLGIISGDGNSDVQEAISLKLDALITGEAHYSSYNDVCDNNFCIIGLGHHFTEVFGVKAVMEQFQRDCGLETVFIDVPCSL